LKIGTYNVAYHNKHWSRGFSFFCFFGGVKFGYFLKNAISATIYLFNVKTVADRQRFATSRYIHWTSTRTTFA